MTRASKLDKDSAVPLYHQIFVALRDAIIAGVHKPGSPLPSERELTKLYGVSRLTVQHASGELQRQGFIVRRQGSGSYVAENRPATPVSASLQALIDNVGAIGDSTEGHLISAGMVVPDAAVRRALGLKAKEQVHRSVHVRSRQGSPIGVFTTCVPTDIGRTMQAQDIEAKPMLVLLDERGYRPEWANQSIGAASAAVPVSKYLGVRAGAPLVRLERTVYDGSDRPIEHLVALYRADCYEYRTVLHRNTAWGCN